MKTNPKRITMRQCLCGKADEFGYDIQKAVRPPKFWSWQASAKKFGQIRAIIAKHNFVLVRCNGCGSELLREHPKYHKSASQALGDSP